MSNTSTITPYDQSEWSSNAGSNVGGALGAACALGAVATAAWLMEETEAERAVLARARQQRREDLLAGTLHARDLLLRDPEPLLRTAGRLGYRLEPLVNQATSATARACLLLRGPDGARVAIVQNSRGGLTLATAGEESRLRRLVREHTAERTLGFLKTRALTVETASLPDGSLQLVATGDPSGHPREPQMKVQIAADGNLRVDVSCVRGPECERLVDGLAQTIGGQVTALSRKEAYDEEPGEPVRPSVRV